MRRSWLRGEGAYCARRGLKLWSPAPTRVTRMWRPTRNSPDTHPAPAQNTTVAKKASKHRRQKSTPAGLNIGKNTKCCRLHPVGGARKRLHLFPQCQHTWECGVLTEMTWQQPGHAVLTVPAVTTLYEWPTMHQGVMWRAVKVCWLATSYPFT